jgi:hypothetical protein
MLPRHSDFRTRFPIFLLLLGLVLGLAALAWFPVQAHELPTRADRSAVPAEPIALAAREPQQTGPWTIHLPALFRYYPWRSPFGVEPRASLRQAFWRDQAVDLGAKWIRLNGRISWRELQPTEGAAIDWGQLANFEDELRALKAEGLTVIVVVDDHPEWATVEEYGIDGARSWCAAIRADKYDAFAQFVGALVARYKVPEFGVRYWELGNEPDVDPSLVRGANPFGCWGDIGDPYYGGERYGQMLKVVTPAIRAEDPAAVVVLGGLLLDKPLTTDPNLGRPELFLEGVLRVGAGEYFDVLAFHAYPSYWGDKIDYDLYPGSGWNSWGGMASGKSDYLRQMMARYGVEKPLFLNETALGCPGYFTVCDPPDAQFFDVQASHVTRLLVRGLGKGIMGFVWYTLDGPGWRYTNLVEDDGTLKPVYVAYRELIDQLHNARYLEPVDQGLGLEAYLFRRGTEHVQVVWAVQDEVLTVSVPALSYVAAYSRDGDPLSPTPVGSDLQFQVGFEPVYIIQLSEE